MTGLEGHPLINSSCYMAKKGISPEHAKMLMKEALA